MRSPAEVLRLLCEKSQDTTYRFQRLYRNLYNSEFYLLAYRNIYANDGSLTPGVDGQTLDGIGMKRIERIISALKNQSYSPKPARRVYIAKKNSTKKRPLGIPSGDDKLVQEVIRMLLESIYEPNFSDRSHGFRPNRSCHTALLQIQKTFTGTAWFVEGDITACFDSFDHHILIKLLRKRIDDEKFIALMWKFLKAGYMEQWEYHATFSGTPQGSGMSPILANIYLHELDSFMLNYAESVNIGDSRKRRDRPEYTKFETRIRTQKAQMNKNWDSWSEEERNAGIQQLRALRRGMRNEPRLLYRDTQFKRVQYVRYADDWLCGVIGSRRDAELLKKAAGEFLFQELHLTLSEAKTKITHGTKRARFLGYDVTVSHSNHCQKTSNGTLKRVQSGLIKLMVPHEKWVSKLLDYGAIHIKKYKGGTEKWQAIHRGELLNYNDAAILSKYNSEVRGFYNYYSIALNAWVVGKFADLMRYSMYKTFAGKYRTRVFKIKERYCVNGRFTVTYLTKKGLKQATFMTGFKRSKNPLLHNLDAMPGYKRYFKPNSIAARLKAGGCELCGKVNCATVIHQVRKLKSLTGSQAWEVKMMEIRRKTLIVCEDCHAVIHEQKS